MKLLILAAGPGNISLDASKKLPTCLEHFDNGQTILDVILATCLSSGIKDHCLVGGFEILKIMRQYPNLHYYYNELWSDTGSLYSLLKASSEFDTDLVISFSDIVYDNLIIEKMIQSDKDVAIAFDSLWEKRFNGRTKKILDNSVIVNHSPDGKIKIGKTKTGHTIGEFVGLVFLKFKIVKQLILYIDSILKRNKKAHIGDLVNTLSEYYDISPYDIKGKWAELDSPQDLVQFKFGTKAETLLSLEPHVEKSKILPQVSFTLDEYELKAQQIVDRIIDKFPSGKIVIRSSAINEDGLNSSMAGHYKSILGVNAKGRQAIIDGIESIKKNYYIKDPTNNPENQILVQPQLRNVTISGVLLSTDLENSAPYYIINYDVTEKTNTVTSGDGKETKTFVYFKLSEELPEGHNLLCILDAVKELELITGLNSLDVEFAIADNEVFILQVRPIAALKDTLKIYNKDIKNELRNIKKYISQFSGKVPGLVGVRTAYGVMPDWNPAEIIGINPGVLAFSLYRNLITDSVWQESRKLIGYRDTSPNRGIASLCGKPYIDIRLSFNTLTPAEISDSTAGKLVDFYIEKLEKNPELHDKVEFEIALSSFDFKLDEKLCELEEHGFTAIELTEIRNALCNLTDEIISEDKISIKKEIGGVKFLV